MDKPAVLFVCVKNAGKSQMAAALMRQFAGNRIEVYSAGTKPGNRLNELSVQALSDVGAPVGDEHPKPIDPHVLDCVDVIVTLGREAQVMAVALPFRTGTPLSPPSAASTASSECDWSATTSPPGSIHSPPSCSNPQKSANRHRRTGP